MGGIRFGLVEGFGFQKHDLQRIFTSFGEDDPFRIFYRDYLSPSDTAFYLFFQFVKIDPDTLQKIICGILPMTDNAQNKVVGRDGVTVHPHGFFFRVSYNVVQLVR